MIKTLNKLDIERMYLNIMKAIYEKPLSLVPQMLKNLPAMQETQIQCLGQEDPLEKGMATHSSILAYGQRSLVGYSPWGHKRQTLLSD